MKNEKYLLTLALVTFLVFSVPVAIADDDEYDDDEWKGYGIMEQEREREHQDDDDNELQIGSGMGDMILYATIGAIVASIGYAGFKILKSKRPMVQKSK
jgi:hypothetical protein